MPYLLNEDDQSFTILEGNNTRVIPKQGLSPSQTATIQQMPRPDIQSAVGGGNPMVQAATSLAPAAVGVGEEMFVPPMGTAPPAPTPARIARGVYPPRGTVHEQIPGLAQAQPEITEPGVRPQPGIPEEPIDIKIKSGRKTKGGFIPKIAGMGDRLKRMRDIEDQMAKEAASGQARIEEMYKQSVELEDLRQLDLDEKNDEIDEIEDSIRNQKIDPANFWSSKSGAQAAMLGIAMMLHGVGNAMQGGDPQNTTRLMMGIIDRDIDAQKEELSKKKDLAGFKINALGRLRQQFSDERAAEAALRSLLVEGMRTNLSSMSERSSSIQQQQAMVNADGRLKIEHARLREEMNYHESQISIERAKLKTKTEVGDKRLSEVTVDKIASLDAAIDNIDILEKHYYEKTGPFSFMMQFVPGSDAKAARLAGNAFNVALVKAMSGVQVSEKEMERLKALQPRPGTFDSDAKEMFQGLRNMMNEKRENFVLGLQRSGYDTGAFQPNIAGGGARPSGQPTIPGEIRY